ncbi:MAG: hypothetical protein HQM14_15225 [SAR324 cluster bacterium]|nr:hypothetical protein [SAR324 cluster bacterium]
MTSHCISQTVHTGVQALFSFVLVVLGCLLLLTKTVQAEIMYSGLIGGIDRGDSASLPTLGFKLAFENTSGWEVTYARGGIRSRGSFFEKERLFALGYRNVSSGSFLDNFLGAGLGIANSTSEAQGHTESVTNLALVISTGANWILGSNIGLKIGLDAFLIPVPGINPLYAMGTRNFWYVGIQVAL